MAKPMTKRLKELVRQLCLILGGIFESANRRKGNE